MTHITTDVEEKPIFDVAVLLGVEGERSRARG
jgi:hypothetical protein